jgi:hypothetical protein
VLIEEVEAIRTAHPVFSAYLSIVEAMLASQRNYLYVGPVIAALELPGEIQVLISGVRPLAVRNCDAAQMFAFNLRTWQDGEFVRTQYRTESIRDLMSGLESIAQEKSAASGIQWNIRQIVFERRNARK